jgi:beta-1,4-mannooligosaccharide/beta-1,4-mannosyl-N-acetylglucosamine phosphorylase
LQEGNDIRIYYGAADAVIGVAEMPLDDILAACHEKYHYFNFSDENQI